jgi:hypothetical protein
MRYPDNYYKITQENHTKIQKSTYPVVKSITNGFHCFRSPRFMLSFHCSWNTSRFFFSFIIVIITEINVNS